MPGPGWGRGLLPSGWTAGHHGGGDADTRLSVVFPDVMTRNGAREGPPPYAKFCSCVRLRTRSRKRGRKAGRAGALYVTVCAGVVHECSTSKYVI